MNQLIILSVLLSLHIVFGQETCQNYYYQSGVCVPLASCPSLNRMNSNPYKSFYDEIILDGSYCPSSSKVCCNDPGVHVTVTTTTSTTTTTRRPVRVTSVRPPATLSLLPVPGSGKCGVQFVDKIVGGEETAINEHPWLALLEFTWPSRYKGFRCGGFLINERYVVTAAHCIKHYNPALTGVRLGEWNYKTDPDCQTRGITRECSDPPQDFTIEKITTHPSYNNNDKHHDIALLRLSSPARFSSYVQSLCLPSVPELQGITNYHGTNFTVAGWGYTEYNKTSDTKLKVNVNGVNQGDCQRAYTQTRATIKSSQICAGGEPGKDSCGGDSGGPLMTTHMDNDGNRYYYAAGLVSFGPEHCGTENVPGVYTNVANYMDWIIQNVKE